MESPHKTTIVLILTLTLVTTGCTVATAPKPVNVIPPLPQPEIVEIPVVVKPTTKRLIPEGSRIVIMDIEGLCATEVKDALMRRLIDNSGYDVLTRENLRQIVGEKELNWSEGDFNTETVTRVGELLGASLFIVGRVSFCGRPSEYTRENDEDTFNVFAALQIIDLETGKVLISSANEGKYLPGVARAVASTELPSHMKKKVNETAAEVTEAVVEKPKGLFGRTREKIGLGGGKPQAVNTSTPANTAKTGDTASQVGDTTVTQTKEEEPDAYLKLKAAEDMANGFADKFFSRPTWENVLMWSNSGWPYSEAIRFVRLGHCREGVEHIKRFDLAVSDMSEADVGRHLHNLGVALLCANELDEAVKKLRSAYRVNGDDETLRMLGLAGKIQEWSLESEVDEEPEIGILMQKNF